jgi:hypothetical protein
VVWSSRSSAAEENHRWRALTPSGEQRAEVGVGGHDHALLLERTIEDLFVAGCLQAIVSDMNSAMPCSRESLGEEWRESVID